MNKSRINNDEKLNLCQAIIITDNRGFILQANVAAHKLFGYINESLEGKYLEDLFNPDINNKIDYLLSQRNDREDTYIRSFYGIRKDNSLINCHINFVPLIYGNRDSMLLQIMDMDRLQAAERKIFELNSHFLNMANKLPGIVYKIQVRPEEKVMYISDGIKKVTGYEPTAFFGKNALNWMNLIHKNDMNRVLESRKTQLANLKQFDVNYRLIRLDGSICWVKDQGTGVYDTRGKLISLQGNILDITSMKQYQYSNYADILDFEDSWKSRISSSINDNLHQILAVSMMNLNDIENEIQSLSRHSVKQYEEGMKLLDQAIRESRKISYELIPKSIRDFGLIPAIEDLLLIWKDKLTERINFTNNMEGTRLPAFHENSIFIILRELLDLLNKWNSVDPIEINLNANSTYYRFTVGTRIIKEWKSPDENDENSLKIIKKRVQAFQGEFYVRKQNNNYIKFEIQAPLKNNSHETY